MKITLLLVCLATSLATTQAQGTFQFTANLNGQNEVPPNNSTWFGSGYFDLSGTTFNYGIAFSAPAGEITNVTINGPASPGSTAPTLFDLGAASIIINPPVPIISGVSGTLNNLTTPQINDLLAGLWYVNVFTASGNLPGGEIRGQIEMVPEPSTWALLGTGKLLLWWYGRRKRTG